VSICFFNTALSESKTRQIGLRERLREIEVIDSWSKIVGDFIAAHSAPVALREGILYVRVLQPALHYELEQISKPEILRNSNHASATRPSATSASASADLKKFVAGNNPGADQATFKKEKEVVRRGENFAD
jgi:hypothetical protein